MSKNVGLWIDHRRAVIVSLTGAEAETKLINSNIEEERRQTGVSELADDLRQSALTEHLKTYYERVISQLRDAKSILIFGPGEAKDELKKRLEIDNLGDRIAGVEAADKMTDPQIAAKVKDHFLHRSAAAGS